MHNHGSFSPARATRACRWSGGAAIVSVGLLCASCRHTGAETAFYAAPPPPPAALPAAGIYPQGRTLAFMGYSGDPGRDLTNGFTVAGPVYGNQAPYVGRCISNRWPVVAHVGPPVTFQDKHPDRCKLDEPGLRQTVAAQVDELATHPEIAWWAIHPEELRPWRGDEMQYLAIVSDTIRAHDPRKRPVFLYNPNHRDAGSLRPIAPWVDVVGKGCYVNSVGRKRDRAWVRWSIEQELAALRAAGRTNAIALLMPELCRDPEPAEDAEIPAWVRHDVYLGLASGAKGVLIWSLFRRGEVRRTWRAWYDAYAGCGRELNGPRGLAQVFLFGAPRTNLVVRRQGAAAEARVQLGGAAEPATTSEQERAAREVRLPAWTAAEYAWDRSRWLFIVNSANEPASFTVTGWPAGSVAVGAFDDAPAPLPARAPLAVSLPAYGVAGIRFSAQPRTP